MKTDTYGTLYGIGVGPGDPDLIPVKAVKALGGVDIIFAAASTKNPHSQAVEIARPHLPVDVELRLLGFPMTKDAAKKTAAWRAHAETILAELAKGRSAAFLTLGDPLTYATYGYVLTQILLLMPSPGGHHSRHHQLSGGGRADQPAPGGGRGVPPHPQRG
jgi:precorrin-2/cobalt-factor-2 C20-methyltransferase